MEDGEYEEAMRAYRDRVHAQWVNEQWDKQYEEDMAVYNEQIRISLLAMETDHND